MRKNDLKIGDVIWVKLYENGKHIQSGVRPAVVIQNNKGNYYSPTIQVVPLTSKTKANLPTHVKIPASVAGLPKASIAQCEGARPVSKNDILDFIGIMPNQYMKAIAIARIISTPDIQYMTLNDIQTVYNQINAP